MSKNRAISHADPFEIPRHLIPPGMIFQWVAKKTPMGRIEPQYQQMVEAGWGEVPYKRLEEHYRGRCRGEGDEILVGGQVLMERAKEISVVARDKEIDKALVNAAQGRSAAVDITQYVKLTAKQLADAVANKMSSPEYIKLRIAGVAHELDNTWIRGASGSLLFVPPPSRRVAKHRWLVWLFNLISKDSTEYTDE